jgi:hypothetical protein
MSTPIETVYVVLVEDENGESTQIHSVHENENTAKEMADSIERESGLIAYVETHPIV